MLLPSTLLLTLLVFSLAQIQPSPGIIETKRIAFGDSNAMVFNTSTSSYALSFQRTFQSIPRIGLGIYTMDFEYSPSFSLIVTNDTTLSSAVLRVSTSNTGQNNQLYLIYIATDHSDLGVFMPPALVTDELNLRLQQNSQSFRFNYKEAISTQSSLENVFISVYLTGISSSSELTNNGYSVNRTYFRMTAHKLEMPFYNITVEVESMFGDITIALVEYTIIYFDQTLMNSPSSGLARYLMDAGAAQFNQFGGTAQVATQPETLATLPSADNFEKETIFYGIAGLDCSRGASIVISVYPTLYNNSNLNQFVLNAETWKLTYVAYAEYNYVQYQSLKCNLVGSNCDVNCQNSPLPHFLLNGICQYCHYSCLTCNASNSVSTCDSCSTTRTLSPSTQQCTCLPGYYDTFQNYTCLSCFPCATCSLSNKVCTTCRQDLHMVINSVSSTCQCTLGFFSNYLNGTTTLNQSQPCLACPEHCLICLNVSFCLACDLQTYLSAGTCFALCSSSQTFESSKCVAASNAQLFDQKGRLGFGWEYQVDRSLINFTLSFSQADCLFYYFQNGTGYALSNSQAQQGQTQNSQFYYDDGNSYAGGYQQSQTAAQNSVSNVPIVGLLGSNAASGFQGASSSAGGSASGSSTSAIPPFNFNTITIGDINSSYLGISQQYYYYLAYYGYQARTGTYATYTDQYGIPYGKVNLSSTSQVASPNFADALSQNLVLTVGNDTLPYQVTPVSNSQFQVTANLPQSYYGETATLALKNPGLVRSGSAASQLVQVSHPVYAYVCTIPSYVSNAESIHDSFKIVVGVLWGLGKYPLFIGFGWIFMPLMLVLQYIMSLNYIDTQRPLNLDLFLASFADFRNPSILYNPLRNNMDASIFTHAEMYTAIPVFYRFDRGIDFLRNCFQFFFVPFLSVILYCLVVGFNKLLNRCRRDIPLISEYLQPRLPLLIGAYVLVQATAVTFFFFAQLNDTKYSSPNQPNSSYPVFNIAMSYLAFFLTCAVPLLLMAFIYYKQTSKETTLKTGSQLVMVFNQLLQSLPSSQGRASLNDPLWKQDPDKTISYGFAMSVFYLAILYGFFTSFFYNNYPYQLAGLVIITVLFGFFAFRSSQFQSTIIKYFWVIFSLLMLAFLLLLAAIGSNASGAPCGQEDLGYLGIGFLIALIIAALIACGYLFWITFFDLYQNYCKTRPFIVNMDEKMESVPQQPQRLKSMREHTSKLKSKIGSVSQFGSQAGIGGGTYARYGQEHPNTDTRLREQQNEDEAEQIAVRERLNFDKIHPQTGNYIFTSERSHQSYSFPEEQGRYLYAFPRIYIDRTGEIYDPEGRYIDTYKEERREVEPVKEEEEEEEEEDDDRQVRRQQVLPDTAGFVSNTVNQEVVEVEQTEEVQVVHRYHFQGQEYEKVRETDNGMLMMRNVKTGRVIIMDPTKIEQVGQKVAEEEEQEVENQVVKRSEPTNIAVRVSEHFRANELPLPQVLEQIVNNVVTLDRTRKIIHNGHEYMNLGEENGLIRLYNVRSKKVEKISREDYLNRYLQSFRNRVNLNGRDYDVIEEGETGKIVLLDVNTKQSRVLSRQQLDLIRKQNEEQLRKIYNYYQPSSNQHIVVESREPKQIERPQVSQTLASKRGQPEVKTYQAPNLLLLQSKATNNRIAESSPNQYGSRTSEQRITYTFNPQSKQTIEMQQYSIQQGNNERISQTIKREYNNDGQMGRTVQYRSSQGVIVQPTNNYPSEFIKETVGKTLSPQKQETVRQEEMEVEEELDPDTIQYILKKSPGPFQMYVMDGDKVEEVDDEDKYDKEQARERKIIYGAQVLDYMKKMERNIPGCVIFMVDLSTKEQYRIN